MDIISEDLTAMNSKEDNDKMIIVSSSVEIISIMINDNATVTIDSISDLLYKVQNISKEDPVTYKELKRTKYFKESLGRVISGGLRFINRLTSSRRNL